MYPPCSQTSRRLALAIAGVLLLHGAMVTAQLVDRVVARVGDKPILASDVRAAIALGLVDVDGSPAPEEDAIAQLIDRRLMLDEMAKSAVPDVDDDAVEEEVRRLRSYAGANLKAVMDSAGIDETLLRQMARDSVRLNTYLAARFPLVDVSDAEAERYYRTNAEAFRRNGVLMPFEQAAPAARDAASRERREARIAQWIAGLRKRTEVLRPAAPATPIAPR